MYIEHTHIYTYTDVYVYVCIYIPLSSNVSILNIGSDSIDG